MVGLNDTLDQMDVTDIYRTFHPKETKIHILFKCTWNIFKDRPHDGTQNQPQQMQENRNHIKHFIGPQGPETRNQSHGKKLKNIQIHETE